ncbi:MAG: hypothetical protein ACXW2A_00965 [Burkholderiales bacterium]
MNRATMAGAAILAAALIAAGAAGAQTGERNVPESATEQKSDRSGKADGRDREKKDELEICKEKAHGLSGPERARVMTDCLREHRPN